MIEQADLGLPEAQNMEQKIWRYMDFAKFVDLLNTEKLYFTSPDKFEDIFEGVLSFKTYNFIRDKYGEDRVKQQAESALVIGTNL